MSRVTLEQQVAEDLKEAMKSKDEAKMRTLRAIKSAIIVEKTSENGGELEEEDDIKLLNKLAKQRRDSIEIYVKEGRDDLAQKEQEELDIIMTYLPEPLSTEEIENHIQEIISRTGASGMQDMGKVMGIANKELLGKADGKTIADIVKAQLSSQN